MSAQDKTREELQEELETLRAQVAAQARGEGGEARQPEAEEALRQSEERYRDLYEKAPLAYFSVGTDGRIKRLNRHAEELLGRVGLGDRTDHRPAEVSGGEKQRVAIARALVRSPHLLLADEPTGNLDRTTAGSIGELLLGLQVEHDMMLIVVTHSSELATQLSRRMELDDGRLVELE